MSESEGLEHFKAACCVIGTVEAFGSGYLVAPDLVVTCEHVVGRVGSVTVVRFPWGATQGVVEQIAEGVDAALVRLRDPAPTRPLRLGPAATVGERFRAFGYPGIAQLAPNPVGLVIEGTVQDPNAVDPLGRPAVQLSSSQNDWPEGMSGAPVESDGVVIGHITRKIPAPGAPKIPVPGALGVLYACPIRFVLDWLRASEPVVERAAPGSHYHARTYVHREPEETRALNLLATQQPIAVVGPELFGKSALIEFLLDHLRDKAARGGLTLHVVKVDISYFVDAFLGGQEPDGDAFVEWLTGECVSAFAPPGADVDRALALQKGGKWTQRLGSFMRSYVNRAAAEKVRVVLVIERGSALHVFPAFVKMFYAELRRWPDPSITERPQILLELSTSLNGASDPVESPFNSPPIEIGDFTIEQAQTLADLHGPTWSRGDLNALMEHVGGHPYLLHAAVFDAGHRSVRGVIKDAQAAQGIFEWPLSGMFWHVIKSERLRTAVARVVGQPIAAVLDPEAVFLLTAAGIVEAAQGGYKLRYAIYRTYLQRTLGV